jgi:16S rRNA (guanine966-N2)-methyltransferase
MRIVAGSHKGATIAAPPGLDTRPTSDRAREAAFNLIGPVDDARVLDLFAGSGAMGLEALSRGAASAVFVESDRVAADTIVRNLGKLRLTGATVLRDDVTRVLAAEAAARRRYDLVLIDPPYAMLAGLLPTLDRYLPPLLERDGLVVVESSSKDEPELPSLSLRTSRRYGAARVTLFGAAA